MAHFLVLYGSYRSNRLGIRLADYLVRRLGEGGDSAELIDAQAVALPMLDKRYSDYAAGTAPPAMAALAEKLRGADGFVFVTGEYNWGMQPGLKNLTDHYLAEWAGRPAGIASYSAGRLAGARSSSAWHPTLTEMGMVVIPATIAVGGIGDALDEDAQPIGDGARALERSAAKFADSLRWWARAASAERARSGTPD